MMITRLAQVLHQVELVAREQNPASGLGPLDQDPADGVDAGGVEAGQRLVEDEQLGLVHQGGGQLHPLLVAVGQRSTLPRARSAMPRPLQPARPAAPGVGARPSPCSRPRYSICSPTSMPGYRPRSSGMYPNRRRSVGPDGPAVPSHPAGVELGQPEDGPHRGRLAGAVGAEEPDHLPAGTPNREVVEGDQCAERATQAFEVEQSTHLIQARSALRLSGSTRGCAYDRSGRLAPF